MRSFDKFVISNTEPRSKEVLWISHNDGEVIASAFVDGEWRPVSGSGGEGEEQRIEALETKMTQAETDIDVLEAAYEGLTQSDIR